MAQQKKQQQQKQKKSDGAENDKDNHEEGKKKKKEPKEEKEKTTPTTVVLKVDMHCDGCASKIVRFLHGFQGVETLKAESDAGKLTITGNVDPTILRDKLARKMKKKVDLISPLPNNKDKEDKSQNQNKNKPEEKKHKEPPVTTAVLKVALHCQGCIERIRKTVSKTKGVHHMEIDKEKETVTVKGTMDAKALAGNLTEKLRRKVEVVPPKKEKEKEKESEKDGADKGDNAKKKKQKGGGDGGGGENKKDHEDGKGNVEQSKMEVSAPANGYGYGYGYGDGYNYGPVYMGQLHAPQMFSDENPNACSIM